MILKFKFKKIEKENMTSPLFLLYSLFYLNFSPPRSIWRRFPVQDFEVYQLPDCSLLNYLI